MRLKVATYADLCADPAAIHHKASRQPHPERLVFDGFTVEDTPDDVLELHDAVLIPAGGVVWKDYWIAHDIEYLLADWSSRDWRPGDYDPQTNTIDVEPDRMAPDRQIDEPVMFCDSLLAATNFGHFVHDFLPYGLLFRRLQANRPALRPLLHAMQWESQRRLIRAVFGVSYESCRQIGYVTAVRRLFVPRRQSYLEGPAWSTSFAGLRAARTLALQSFGIDPPVHAALAPTPSRVFLHREQDVVRLTAHGLLHGRDYANIPDLAMLMLRHGFVAVEPGRVVIERIAAVLAQAGLVVGIHGANIGNILFCPPGARVLELRTYHGNWRDYEMLAGVLGLDFRPVQQPPQDTPEPPRIDIEALSNLLSADSPFCQRADGGPSAREP